MTRQTQLRPEFVTFVPGVLAPGVLYVSIKYATVLHTCCCGCGNKVVTPLAPDRWCLTYDGKTVSLDHSIGNWSFPCQSHYWIEGNAVLWDHPFTHKEVAAVRAADQRAMKRAGAPLIQRAQPSLETDQVPAPAQSATTWWRRLLARFYG